MGRTGPCHLAAPEGQVPRKAPSCPGHPSGHQSRDPSQAPPCYLWPTRMLGAELLLIKPLKHRQMWACSQFLHDSGWTLLKMVQLKGALEVVLSSPLHSLPTPPHPFLDPFLPPSPSPQQQAHAGTLSRGLDIPAPGAEDQTRTGVPSATPIVQPSRAVTHTHLPPPRAVSFRVLRWEVQECERGGRGACMGGADPLYSHHQKQSFIM